VTNKQKGPKSLVKVDTSKTPKSQFRDDWQEMYPCWRVSLLETVEPFGWHTSEQGELLQVKQRFASFESMTWKQILCQAGYRNHFVSRDRLCADAQKRLREMGQDDVDSVISLGITQKSRVFGIMEHNVLKVLWWDPEHLVYPVEKPNT